MAISGASLYGLYKALEPILNKVVDKAQKELREEFVFIPWWHSNPNKYVYHIDPQLRERMYSYLKTDDALKKIGIAFGNELVLSQQHRVIDIGFYGFLPFSKLAHFHGKERLNGKTVAEVCAILEKELTNKKKAGDKILASARLLANFALQKCADENFPRLLAKGSDDFANAYAELYKEIHNSPYGGKEYRQHVLARFLRASFHGLYTSSKGFVGLSISTSPTEFARQAEEIASKIGKESFEVFEKFKRKLRFLDRLIVVFEPNEKQDIVAGALGRLPSINAILTNKVNEAKLRLLMSSFKNDMWYFDTEMRTHHSIKGIPSHRVPTVVNLFPDENAGKVRSVCAGYNMAANAIHQIKFGRKIFGRASVRCRKVAERYNVKDHGHLPSEANHHSVPKPHSD
ncbi:TPA: hypothetical protein H1009_01970 [archaeon]|nr:hypothetical protein [Candidatus Naiadarchaeales archaeon SRR2090153.bin461]